MTFGSDLVSVKGQAKGFDWSKLFEKGQKGTWINNGWYGHGSTFVYDPEHDVVIEIDHSN